MEIEPSQFFFNFKEIEYFNKNLQWEVQEISKGYGKPQKWGAVSSPFTHLGGSGSLGVPEQGLKQPPASRGGSGTELHSFLTSPSNRWVSNRYSQHKGCSSVKQQFCSPQGETVTAVLVGTNNELMVKMLVLTCGDWFFVSAVPGVCVLACLKQQAFAVLFPSFSHDA